MLRQVVLGIGGPAEPTFRLLIPGRAAEALLPASPQEICRFDTAFLRLGFQLRHGLCPFLSGDTVVLKSGPGIP